VIESLIGAVYLDSNCCLETSWRVVNTLLPQITNDRNFSNVEIDWKRKLHETFGTDMKLAYLPPENGKGKHRVTCQVGTN